MRDSLFAGELCSSCPARKVCVDRETDRACDPYRDYRGVIRAQDTTLSEVSFRWPDPPTWRHIELPPAWATSNGSTWRSQALGRTLNNVKTIVNTRGSAPGRIAVMFGSDDDLRWVHRNTFGIGPQLVEAGIRAAVAPAFSVYHDASPFEHAVSIAVTAHHAVELNRHLPTIPSVVWNHDGHLEQWAEWLHAGNATTIAVHFDRPQPTGPKRDWHIRSLGRLSSLCPGLRLLAHGPASRSTMTPTIEAWDGPVSFVSEQPTSEAAKGVHFTEDLDRIPPGDRSSVDDNERARLLELNCDRYAQASDRYRRAKPAPANPHNLTSGRNAG